MRAFAIFPLALRHPRRHRGLAHEERPCDVRGAQSAHEPERERDLGLDGEGGVAAREDEPQPVVLDLLSTTPRERRRRLVVDQQGKALSQRGLAAQLVDRDVPRGGRQPRTGAPGDAGRAPGDQRARKGRLHALLGEVEVGRHPDGRSEHVRPVALWASTTAAATAGSAMARWISQTPGWVGLPRRRRAWGCPGR